MIPDATLYLLDPDDARAARLLLAGRPVAFRALLAVVRAGARRVAIPGALRSPELERAIAGSPRARATAVWLDAGTPLPAAPTLLVPAVAVAPAPAIALVLGASAPAVLAESREVGAPIVLADAALLDRLADRLAAGAPVGAALAGALSGDVLRVPGGAWCVRVLDAQGVMAAETRLYASLGSPIDTRLDTILHRRLSRLVSRRAVAWALTPNQITVASLLVGLAAVGCFWGATPWSALAGLLLYVAAVVLDHADGEVARLTLTESALGEWLDILADTAIHALLVVAMGTTAQRVAGDGAALGLVAGAGVVVSAVLAKLWPPEATTHAVGGVLEGLSSRDGFYAMLVLFIAVLALVPAWLPLLMILVALGTHAYWLARAAWLLLRRLT